MEDNLKNIPAGLLGTKDTGEKVIKSIYKVKRGDNTNIYDRIHFETQSKMICDATHLANVNMVARRDVNGDIQFRNILANGTITAKGASDLQSTLRVAGVTTLGSSLTVAGTSTLNGLLNANQNAAFAKNISVTGTASLSGAVTMGSTLNVTDNVTTGGGYFLPNCSISKNGTLINFGISGTGVDGFNFNKKISVQGSASIDSTLNVKGAVQADSTITANSNITTKGAFILPGAEIKKDSSTNSILFNSLSDSSGVNFNKNLTVDGASVLKSTLSVTGISNLTGNVSAKNNLEVLKAFSVSGNSTLGGALSAVGLVSTNTGLQIPGAKIEKVGSSANFSALSGGGVNDFYFNKPIRMDANSVINPNFNADKVDGCDVSDSLTTTTNLWTSKKIDDTKANKATRVNAGEGLVGGGSIGSNITITHATPATVAKTFTTRRTEVIKSIEFDKFGHSSKVTTLDMESVFATPSQVAELVANLGETVKNQFIAHSILRPDGTVSGPARNDVNNLNMKNYSIDYNTSAQCIQFTFV